jgi:hypothetical protein
LRLYELVDEDVWSGDQLASGIPDAEQSAKLRAELMDPNHIFDQSEYQNLLSSRPSSSSGGGRGRGGRRRYSDRNYGYMPPWMTYFDPSTFPMANPSDSAEMPQVAFMWAPGPDGTMIPVPFMPFDPQNQPQQNTGEMSMTEQPQYMQQPSYPFMPPMYPHPPTGTEGPSQLPPETYTPVLDGNMIPMFNPYYFGADPNAMMSPSPHPRSRRDTHDSQQTDELSDRMQRLETTSSTRSRSGSSHQRQELLPESRPYHASRVQDEGKIIWTILIDF